MLDHEFTPCFGAEMSPPDVRDYRLNKECVATEFPEYFELRMPPVKSQGQVGSCVAHSIALVSEYYNREQLGIEEEISVGYIYGNRSLILGNQQGMITRFAIAKYCTDGAPYKSQFPDHYEVPDIIKKVEEKRPELEEFAEQFRFTSYIVLKTDNEIKTALMNGNPVIVAVKWQKDMKYKDGKFYTEFPKQKPSGHAMVLYGWTPEGWLIQNSWGAKWGNNGTAIWPYEYKIREKFAIIDEDNTPLKIDKPHSSKSKTNFICVKIFNFLNMIWYKLNNAFSKM